ncbi:hypothetical protein [Sinorhizobium meliloti]|uniref:hypothetical protein n=1 Tax=Rhizobium meliloti TaxID=382 RepID=UPI0013E31B66|nr:hypothetical protein [Sinorhizobium meliloti]MDW9639716.1 hypothetical protein [Sinorhizobium meliloti]MDW9769267.1 hypothetical protein [Sinorhizobium meliloti]MDW9991711.1 hypothetical protein [Sinorhizobium meliloti]MDX0126626.1 hypothetical protein [Sinorhizobium meliloti]MDX0246059.1 hypothetical protein [Sinorhizobium meliloti]
MAPVSRLSKSRRAGCCGGLLVHVKCDRDIRMIILQRIAMGDIAPILSPLLSFRI